MSWIVGVGSMVTMIVKVAHTKRPLIIQMASVEYAKNSGMSLM